LLVSSWNEIGRALSPWIFVLGGYPGLYSGLVWGAPLALVGDDSLLLLGLPALEDGGGAFLDNPTLCDETAKGGPLGHSASVVRVRQRGSEQNAGVLRCAQNDNVYLRRECLAAARMFAPRRLGVGAVALFVFFSGAAGAEVVAAYFFAGAAGSGAIGVG
jgi:hypothetical protein